MQVMEFVDSGRNLLIAISPASSNNLRAIASECGIIPDVENAFVQVQNFVSAVDPPSLATSDSPHFFSRAFPDRVSAFRITSSMTPLSTTAATQPSRP